MRRHPGKTPANLYQGIQARNGYVSPNEWEVPSNRRRRHSALKYLSPVAYEQQISSSFTFLSPKNVGNPTF